MAANIGYLLYESAVGYALFNVDGEKEENIAGLDDPKSVSDFGRFSKIITLIAFQPYENSEDALANQNAVSEGLMHDTLKHFLEMNHPHLSGKSDKKKKSKLSMAVAHPSIGNVINETLHISCASTESISELYRGIREHFHKYIKGLTNEDVGKAQLGLGHSYSRAKVKFNVNRADNMIIQSISLLDQVEKDLNTFSMRVKEWYGWHFPELTRIVGDNVSYAKLVIAIQNRKTLKEEGRNALEEITKDEAKAQEILDAAKSSMGTDISDYDVENIIMFANRVVSLAAYKVQLADYLKTKVNTIAPNLTGLIGELVTARLISHAGSLTNLAKYPASTVQILGAEKALFRALKTRGNTPKYGLIFHSSFIGKANAKNKGRISRYLANKCSMAARIDCFSDVTTSKYGEKLKEQVEQRLNFYNTGEAPQKNLDVMESVSKELKSMEIEKPAETTATTAVAAETEEKVDKKKKKKKKGEEDVAPIETKTPVKATIEESTTEKTPAKSEKKKKKKKGEEVKTEENQADQMEVEQTETPVVTESEKKEKEEKEI